MKKILFISVLFLMACQPREQVTVQVAGSWNIGDTKTYRVTIERTDSHRGETEHWQINRHKVTITIIDSTDDYYIIDWHNHDFEFYSNDVDWMNVMRKNLTDGNYIIRTNRLGTFEKLVNWEEIRERAFENHERVKQMRKSNAKYADLLDYLDYLDSFYAHLNEMFSKQEVIEARWIDEVRQFFMFHGGQFNLGRRNRTTSIVQQPNIWGFELVDATRSIWIEEIDAENETFLVRMHQKSNPRQLLNATIRTFQHNLELEMRPLIERGEETEEELKEYLSWLANMNTRFRYEIEINSTIHNSGWLIHSVQTQEVFENRRRTRLNTFTIELQQ